MNEVGILESTHIAKILVVYDQNDAAPEWGYRLRQQELSVRLERSIEKIIQRGSTQVPGTVRNCFL